MEKATKVQIDECVKAYQDVLHWDYAQFLSAIKDKRTNLKDEKFGTAKGSEVVERVLYEVPVALFDIMTRRLDVKQIKELKTKEGARWFAKTYPQYRLTNKV